MPVQIRLAWAGRHHWQSAYGWLALLLMMCDFADLDLALLQKMHLIWLLWLCSIVHTAPGLWANEREATFQQWVFYPKARQIMVIKWVLYCLAHMLAWIVLSSWLAFLNDWPTWVLTTLMKTIVVIPVFTALIILLSALTQTLRENTNLLSFMLLPLAAPLIILGLTLMSNPAQKTHIAQATSILIILNLLLVPAIMMLLPPLLKRH